MSQKNVFFSIRIPFFCKMPMNYFNWKVIRISLLFKHVYVIQRKISVILHFGLRRIVHIRMKIHHISMNSVVCSIVKCFYSIRIKKFPRNVELFTNMGFKSILIYEYTWTNNELGIPPPLSLSLSLSPHRIFFD